MVNAGILPKRKRSYSNHPVWNSLRIRKPLKGGYELRTQVDTPAIHTGWFTLPLDGPWGCLGCNKSHVFFDSVWDLILTHPLKLKTYDSHISHVWKEINLANNIILRPYHPFVHESQGAFFLGEFFPPNLMDPYEMIFAKKKWTKMVACFGWLAKIIPQTSQGTLRKCNSKSFPPEKWPKLNREVV